jgi:hypothetical protein
LSIDIRLVERPDSVEPDQFSWHRRAQVSKNSSARGRPLLGLSPTVSKIPWREACVERVDGHTIGAVLGDRGDFS